MSDTKVTDLTAITTPDDADLVTVVDVSDTTMDPTGTNKKFTWANLKATLKPYLDTLYAAALGADDNYVTDAEKTVIGNTSGTNTGNETASTIGTILGAVSNTSISNNDNVPFTLQAGGLYKITWTSIKATLKTYFDSLYLSLGGGTMTGNITLGENTSIDLDPAGSADGKYSGICITGTAGATLAFGDLVYLAVATSKWVLTDADAIATAGHLTGMCVLAANDTEATKILLQGQIRADAKFPALTVGAPVYLGETAGAIQVAIPTGADNVIRVVGFALTADEIYLNVSPDNQSTVA